jgi:nitrate reductase gamma subunit
MDIVEWIIVCTYLLFIFIALILPATKVSEKFYMILFSIQLCVVFQILNLFIFLTSQIFYAMWMAEKSKNPTNVFLNRRGGCILIINMHLCRIRRRVRKTEDERKKC